MGIKEDKIKFETFAKKKKRQSFYFGLFLILIWVFTANPFKLDSLIFVEDLIPQRFLIIFHLITRIFLIFWLFKYNQFFRLDFVYAALLTLFSPAMALIVIGILKSKKEDNNFFRENKFD